MGQAAPTRGGVSLETLVLRQRATGEPVPLAAALALLADVTQAVSRHHSAPGIGGRPRREAHGDVGLPAVRVSPTGQVSLGAPASQGGQDLSIDLTAIGRLVEELVTLEPTALHAGAGGRMLALDQIADAERRIRRVSLELALVFRRCVHEAAEDRYLDAGSLLRDLQRMRGKLPGPDPLPAWLAAVARQPAPDATTSKFALQLDSPAPPPTPAPRRPAPAVPDLFAGSSTAPAVAPVARPDRPRRERAKAPRTPAPPSSGKKQVWQKRAARKALVGQLVGLVAVGLVALFGATFLPGEIGDEARALWEPLEAWVRGLVGR